jgi:protein-disulfide isomerase-like protein with CxxC motif
LELELKQQFKLARQLSSQGFPSLVLSKGGKLYAIPLDYNDSQTMQQAIMQHTSEAQ